MLPELTARLQDVQNTHPANAGSRSSQRHQSHAYAHRCTLPRPTPVSTRRDYFCPCCLIGICSAPVSRRQQASEAMHIAESSSAADSIQLTAPAGRTIECQVCAAMATPWDFDPQGKAARSLRISHPSPRTPARFSGSGCRRLLDSGRTECFFLSVLGNSNQETCRI